MKKIGKLCLSAIDTIKQDGITDCLKKTGIYVSIKANELYKKQEERIGRACKDVLFIKGEQLNKSAMNLLDIQRKAVMAAGLTCDCIFYTDISYSLLKKYRVFILSGCVYNNLIAKIVKTTRRLNKIIIYSLFSGIDKKLIKMCDGIVISTESQKEELKEFEKDITAIKYYQITNDIFQEAIAFGNYIRKLRKCNIVFVLPSVQISGGVLVILEHLVILQKAGYDVVIYNMEQEENDIKKDEHILPVISMKKTRFFMEIDKAVASMWTTCHVVQEMQKNSKIESIYYLVQNFETNFYEEGSEFKIKANATYFLPSTVNYITISKWCQKWLEEDYGRKTRYAPNGINEKKFCSKERKFNGKIRILIEGDCSAYFKNVDESFEIVKKLDKQKYEICYMSYLGKPKEWYDIDEFFYKVPHEKVSDVYRSCDILLKSSILESFSYPPLEMMATGGFVVVVPNGGNIEYLKHGENALLYEQGDISAAVAAIERICIDEQLRKQLYLGGIKTAQERDWHLFEREILDLYQ